METKNDYPTLGGVINRFRAQYPACTAGDGEVRRIIWQVDRAFAIETGQDVPERYTEKQQKNTVLLVPKIEKVLYYWAILRSANGNTDAVTDYYNDRYTQAKQCAIATWRLMQEGGQDDIRLI